MKFSFINPSPNVELPTSEKRKAIGSWPPLGTLYIATFLKNEGFEVSVLDQSAQSLSVKDTVDWVRQEDPDILGFSTLSSSGRTAAIIAREVKKENPDLTIVFGNYHATFNAERILETYPFVDIIVRGEGEYTSLELTECLKKNGSLKKVMGITFRERKQIVSTPERPLLKKIDALPFPNRELLPVEYHSTIVGANIAPKRFTSIISSRGCVYRCRFCGCRKFAKNIWRPRSVENILEELRMLVGEGYRQFLFVDDNFALNQKRAVKLCREIRKEKMDIEWICDSRVDHSSYEMLRETVRAGCIMMYFGIESANQWVLRYYNKQTTPQQAEVAVKNARKAGVDVVVGSFIVGAPNETRPEIQNTLKFAQRLDLDVPQFNILGAFPGTDLWDELALKGVIDADQYWETGLCVSEVSPDTVPYEEIQRMIRQYFYDFLLRPRYLAAQLMRTLKSRYRIHVMINNLSRRGAIAESLRQLS
ncbi:MAG: cobalamin-dependent protein [Candidatus Bathyarchaeota archaeon]|nr:MAG: cobalamin-dependent protein [Candidatus Bathyarchaeota archaeon]